MVRSGNSQCFWKSWRARFKEGGVAEQWAGRRGQDIVGRAAAQWPGNCGRGDPQWAGPGPVRKSLGFPAPAWAPLWAGKGDPSVSQLLMQRWSMAAHATGHSRSSRLKIDTGCVNHDPTRVVMLVWAAAIVSRTQTLSPGLLTRVPQ